MASNNTNILHQQFQEFTGSVFNILYSDQEFTDVTLVVDEYKQIQAHKVILSSSSKLFRRILIKNPHPHPLVYLKDVSYEILQYILQFLYIGQVDISTEYVPLFMKTARDLGVNGLEDSIDSYGLCEVADEVVEDEVKESIEEFEDNKKELKSGIKYENECLEMEILQKHQNISPKKQLKNKPASFHCTQCNNTFVGKNDLKKHTRTVHEGVSYPLTNAERVKRWKERKMALVSEEAFQEMRKLEHQKRNAEVRARRLKDKNFDEKFKRENRERKRRLREKKSLEEALAHKQETNNL